MGTSHPNLSDSINQALSNLDSAAEIDLSLIQEGVIVTFKTANTLYAFERMSDGSWLCRSGNPKFFRDGATRVRIIGCTFGGSMIKVNSIFVGGYVEISIIGEGGVLTTSQVTQIGDGHSKLVH